MTELLFLTDPNLREFEARVLSSKKEKDRVLVELDRTAFHPQGAGQGSDTGEIVTPSGTGHVVDVLESEGMILHMVTGLESVSGAVVVKCRIDWPRRGRLAALHTGEHILMASLIKLGRGRFDLDKILIDENGGKLFVSGEVSLKDAADAEKIANHAIRECLPVKFHLFGSVDEAMEKFPALRIKEEKVKGSLRVVEVEGFDASACSGTHAANTAEVGVVKVFRLNRHSGSSILEFDVGERAIDKMATLSNNALDVSEALGTEPHKAPAAASNLKLRAKSLYDNLRRVGKIAAASVRIEPIPLDGGLKLYSANLSGMADKEDVVKLGKSIVQKEPNAVAVIVGGFEEPFFVVCARGSSVSSDMKVLASEMCGLLGGGAGGKPDFATGAGRNAEKIEEALGVAKKRLSG